LIDARDLKILLEEADIMESKAFLRSFIKRIDISTSQGVIHYNLPVPPHGEDTQLVRVLPVDTFGGAGGIRTPYLLNAIQALSQLSYSPRVYTYILQ
jgi:site-specific DNA recombinase